MSNSEYCAKSQRVDGKKHSWKFDGDDPYKVIEPLRHVATTNSAIKSGEKVEYMGKVYEVKRRPTISNGVAFGFWELTCGSETLTLSADINLKKLETSDAMEKLDEILEKYDTYVYDTIGDYPTYREDLKANREETLRALKVLVEAEKRVAVEAALNRVKKEVLNGTCHGCHLNPCDHSTTACPWPYTTLSYPIEIIDRELARLTAKEGE